MRESARAALLFTVILALLLILAAAWRSQAYAHDWYSGIRNPSTGWGCCGGRDCFSLRLSEMGRLTEDNENFIIDGKWKFPKKEAMPVKDFHPDPELDESGYHFCIWGGKPRCFFFPTGA